MSPVIPKQFLWCGGAYFSCLGRPLLSKCHCLGWCACSAPMFGWMATQIMSKHPHECQDRRFPSRTVLCNTLSELFTCQWFYCFSTRFFFFLSAVPNGNCVTPRFSKQFGVFFFHLVFHSVNNGLFSSASASSPFDFSRCNIIFQSCSSSENLACFSLVFLYTDLWCLLSPDPCKC